MNNQRQNSSRSGTPSTNPLATARERLQTSARELLRSIEDVVLSSATQQPREVRAEGQTDSCTRRRELQPTLREGAASIEHALRVMFSSCTGAGDVGTASEEPLADLQFQTITPTKDNAISNNNIVTPPTAATSNSSPPSGSNRRPSPSQRDIGEHIYAQLFHDDTIRAEKAVETLRGYETPEQNERQRQGVSPHVLSKPFPISTPPRTFPAPSQELHLPASLTFDDAISAISAHTLEAMADSNHPVPVSRSERKNQSKECSTSLFLSEPNSFDRIRSSGSHSRFSLPSKGNNSRQSKTTLTTESSGSSFEIWQAQEQKFWDDMVQLDGSRRRHPHDTFSFDENPFIQPVIREDISYLPGTFLEEEEIDYLHADMGEI